MMNRQDFTAWQAELIQKLSLEQASHHSNVAAIAESAAQQSQSIEMRRRSDLQRTTAEFRTRYEALSAEFRRLVSEYEARRDAEQKQLFVRRDEQLEIAAIERTRSLSDGEYDWFLSRQRVRKEYEQQKQAVGEAYQRTQAAWRAELAAFEDFQQITAESLARHGTLLPVPARQQSAAESEPIVPREDPLAWEGTSRDASPAARTPNAAANPPSPAPKLGPGVSHAPIPEAGDEDDDDDDEDIDLVSPANGGAALAPRAISPTYQEAMASYQECVTAAQQLILHFRRRTEVRFIEERWGILVFVVLSVVLTLLSLAWFGWQSLMPLVLGSAAAALVLSAFLSYVMRRRAHGLAQQASPSVSDVMHQARLAIELARDQCKLQAEVDLRQLKHERRQHLAQLDADWKARLAEIHGRYQQRHDRLQETVQKKQEAIASHWQQSLQQVHDQYQPELDRLQNAVEGQTRQINHAADSRLTAVHQQRQAALLELRRLAAATWQECVIAEQAMQQMASQALTDLDIDWDRWQPPLTPAAVLPLGQYEVAQPEGWPKTSNSLPNGDDSLRDVDSTAAHDAASGAGSSASDATRPFRFPVALVFPQAPSLLLEADEQGRQQAVTVLQLAMLRMLANVPAGKLRFTIIDPVGLGQNFSAFMHLADYDERLVGSRIWTEGSHIQQRLADLTEHMENVIQTYLRNQFGSIQEYNRHAGEVAEPFQVLVVANFPAGFTDEAARRLASIAASGARCGVYTLISTDSKMALPRNFDLGDLRTRANTFHWSAGSFYSSREILNAYPITWDDLPGDATTTRALHRIGELSRDANRVEVPFAVVAPAANDYWTGDSRAEIRIPLGRAGAAKLQHLSLGKGTSQHVLVSGKTGSGKSTLLHAIVTNAALRYSPGEVQFYLIDFKKGVEFKAYAQHHLPHAKVIAIESEREFGMSVLERLDVELRRRGDLFRRASVQSVAGYRDARPDEFMPRILLMIDEFQEFFVKEDKISQDAALLLDRLVRQGRAFGIHVILGTQTLAGAYSLARSTIGQIAVRVALQCSAADAHLILSEENDAARLLRRPGEAIYNDANGLVEGNHPFQVVWLPDSERESYLHTIGRLAASHGLQPREAIVFEGNVPARAAGNSLLRNALRAPRGREVRLAPRAWLGEAISIREAPAAVFHRRGGSNLLLVGQHEDSALGILANAVVSLAAFSATDDAAHLTTQFYVLDGARPESEHGGYWSSLAAQLPLTMHVAKPRDATPPIVSLREEVERRQRSDAESEPPVFVVIHDLARFRGLQRSDDDFGFGRGGSFNDDEAQAATTSAAADLARLLKDGPQHGVHVLLWVDSYINLNRWLERQSLADLSYRVLFQMSATDSSNLMDSPAAAQLGPHRAMFYNEDQGTAERFRPYGLPSVEWLHDAAEWLRGKGLGDSEPSRPEYAPE